MWIGTESLSVSCRSSRVNYEYLLAGGESLHVNFVFHNLIEMCIQQSVVCLTGNLARLCEIFHSLLWAGPSKYLAIIYVGTSY